MDRLRIVAYQTIGRAVGFACLAILCVMAGCAFDPLLAARSGGILLMILLIGLLYKAHDAQTRDVRRSEAWLYLSEDERPAADRAMAAALREAYLWFARWIAGAAALMWAGALLISLTGIGPSGLY